MRHTCSRREWGEDGVRVRVRVRVGQEWGEDRAGAEAEVWGVKSDG